MRNLKKSKKTNKKTRRYTNIAVFLSLIYMLFCFMGASGALKEIYKVPKVKKVDFKDKTHDTLTGSEKNLEKGYVYNLVGRTDPFKSFLTNSAVVSQKKANKKPKTYLETLELSQLDLTAVIISQKGNWAMVRDPKGVGYIIRKGVPIGINGGVVYQILEGVVIVREKHIDVNGRVKYKKISKKLPL